MPYEHGSPPRSHVLAACYCGGVVVWGCARCGHGDGGNEEEDTCHMRRRIHVI